MKKLINNTSKLFIICLFFMGTQAKAQANDDDILFPSENPGAPAPINDYLPLLLLGGIALGFVYTRKRRRA
jgi:hypothetical protein